MLPTLPTPPGGPPPGLGPPYSPQLINLNQTYNMSGNALTEALLLLSGVYLSLVQPDPGPAKVGLHAIFPETFGMFVNEVTRKLDAQAKHMTLRKYRGVQRHLNVSSSVTRSEYAPKDLLNAICEDVFPVNTITIFYLNNAENLQKYPKPTADYLPRIISSLGLPIIAYDTQFSPNARPPLSVQLAPTMGQLIDVMFSFLKKYNWTDFSFICTLSKGCRDEIAAIRKKVDDSHMRPVSTIYGTEMFSFNLLSYVNVTNGTDKAEVRDKLEYEMDRDTRIVLMHGEESEAMTILEVAKEEGLTGKEYVWILTGSSIKITETISASYPPGSFVIGFDSDRNDMTKVVDTVIDIWLQGLSSLVNSPDLEKMDFKTGFTCSSDPENRTSTPTLQWKYGHILYKHIMRAKLSGNIEFDEHGVLKGNRFWIKNIQKALPVSAIPGRDRSRSGGGGGRERRPGGRPSGGGIGAGRGGGIGAGRGGGNGRGGDSGDPWGSSLSGRGGDSGNPWGSSLSGRGGDSRRPSGSSLSGRGGHSRRPSGSSILGRNKDSRRPSTDRGSSSLQSRTNSRRPSSGRRDPGRSSYGGSRSRTEEDRNDGTRSGNSSLVGSARSQQSSRGSGRSSFFNHDMDKDSSRNLPTGRSRGQPRQRGGGYHRDAMARGPGGLYNGRRTRKTRSTSEEILIAKKIADWDGQKLVVTSITWPGDSSKPPKGKPEKYNLRVATWREDPHVMYVDPDNTTGECDSHSLPCTIYERDDALRRIGNATKEVCCTGLCIDLLKRLSEELHIDVTLFETPDGTYGSPIDKNLTKWTGLMGMLLRKEAELAMAALSITPERSIAVDFSVPFLQTGIAIIVAIREGVISPTAFLEPYDYLSWTLILVFSVHATGASIFIFEWLSPYGMDHGRTPLSVHKFSLFRSFWLIWAMLFGASVSTDMPRGCASRFLANIWALFAVVFCASYTANLAAFMITKDDYYDLSGIQDWRLKNPNHRQPPFKFATIANSSTDTNIENNYPNIHSFMSQSAQTDVKSAIKSLKNQDIQAFIYDSTTLEYEVGKDDGCRLKTVGKRIAETGYGIAFPHRSQWRKKFDAAVLRLQENGEIERTQKFWLAGACHKKKERVGVSSHTLGILNFTSAFILLGGGIILGAVLLTLEHMYFRFGRKSVRKWDKYGCCSLISLSMGQSLTFEQSVMEAIDFHRHHKCKDPLCETQLWKVKHELDLALIKISQLRKQIAHASSTHSEGDSMKDIPQDGATSAMIHENGTAPRRRRQNRKDGEKESPATQPLLSSDQPNESDDDGKERKSVPPAPAKRKSVESDINGYTNLSMYENYPNEGDGTKPRPRKRSSISKQESPKEADDGQRPKAPPPDDVGAAPKPNPEPIPNPNPTLADLELHPPPPAYLDTFSNSPGDMPDGTMSPPSPPLPPPPPPPRPGTEDDLNDLPLPEGPFGYLPEPLEPADVWKYEPEILDSPELPSSPSFSDNLANRPPSPGGISKLSNERLSSPDRSSILSDGSAVTKTNTDQGPSPSKDGRSRNPFINNAQPQQAGSYSSDPAKNNGDVALSSPKEADNDVNLRRPRSSDHYVNVGNLGGKETAF